MEKPLIALACLLRSISHKYRNDLSVLQNELTYIKSLTPEGECDRALEVIRELGEALKISDLVRSGKIRAKEINIKELISKMESSGVLADTSSSLPSDISIKCDIDCLLASLLGLVELFNKISNNSKLGKKPGFRLSTDAALIYLDLQCEMKRVLGLSYNTEVECDSFSSFVLDYIKIDSEWAALSDVIIWAHGGSISVKYFSSGDLKVRITIG